jgi:lysophospholipid acyltransferase (LPLAT)-like uncharacterized protein
MKKFLIIFFCFLRALIPKQKKSVQQKNKEFHRFNGTIFGIWHVHLDHRISSVHIVVDQQRVMYDHIEREYLVFVFLLLHPQIFGYKQQVI